MNKTLGIALILLLAFSFVIACQPAATPTPPPPPPPAAKTTAAPTAAPVAKVTQTPAPAAKPTQSPSPAPTAKPTQAPPPAEARVEKWRVATAEEGTLMYSAGVAIARVANKYVKGVELTASPVPASAMSHQLFQKGEVDITYGGALALSDAWSNKGLFEKTPVTYRTYQGIYLFTGEQFVITKGDNKTINKLGDLAGKTMFPMTSASAAYEAHKLILSALGVWDKIQERQMGTGEAAEALRTGRIDSIGSYTSSGNLAPWMKELELRVDVRVVTPSDAEKEQMKKIPGMSVVVLPTEKTFSKPAGDKEIYSMMSPMGFQFGPNLNPDLVYQIVKAWYEHADELVAINPAFAAFAKDGVGINTMAFDSLTTVAIHPGVAKFYQEKGAWKNNWKAGQTQARP
ncbi:MAG: TAXI family TRAP transporter solute-binding subunit [Chloroflexi bacterium]|nr:TAXI family TRAP transporter solute-binding subunit [Chloroflexota bacterium]